jgi:hypothetical protein
MKSLDHWDLLLLLQLKTPACLCFLPAALRRARAALNTQDLLAPWPRSRSGGLLAFHVVVCGADGLSF